MNILITICARGGSKGVPNKNIRPLLGKPLIAYTIQQARDWGKAAHVVVSTDSPAIAEVAKQYGAEVPFLRPAVLAQDSAPKLPVIRHALQECERLHGCEYPLIVDLDPTAPIRQPEDLSHCLELFISRQPLTLFSVVPAHKNPYFNMVEATPEGYVRLCKKLPQLVDRRQEAPAVYNMNASIYFYQRAYLLDEANISAISDRSVPYVMDEKSAHDIDREIDFKFLEFLVKEKRVLL